jgi:hypothetical protein
LHGAPYRFQDPARFSLAHGGKDRHPYPVPLKVYDETIRVLKSAVQNAKLGREEEMGALKRLDDQARRLKRTAQVLPSKVSSPALASPDLSLGSVCKFRFRRKTPSGWERLTLETAPRSIYLMDGAARQEWEHSIPPVEAPRMSITFRAMAARH